MPLNSRTLQRKIKNTSKDISNKLKHMAGSVKLELNSNHPNMNTHSLLSPHFGKIHNPFK